MEEMVAGVSYHRVLQQRKAAESVVPEERVRLEEALWSGAALVLGFHANPEPPRPLLWRDGVRLDGQRWLAPLFARPEVWGAEEAEAPWSATLNTLLFRC